MTCWCGASTGNLHSKDSEYRPNGFFLLALQPWACLGLLNNQSPLLSVFRLLYPLLYLHCFQVCYNIIHPSQRRSSSPLSYKQFSFHHLPWHRSYIHSLYMSLPSYPLSFHEFHNILSVYGSIQFFIISNSPHISLLERPTDPPHIFLSKILNKFSSDFVRVQVSDPYITTGLISILYISILTDIFIILLFSIWWLLYMLCSLFLFCPLHVR